VVRALANEQLLNALDDGGRTARSLLAAAQAP
jgi:hypothetical protein